MYFNAAQAVTFIGIVGVSSLPGRFILSHLSDRINRQAMLAGVLVAEAVGLIILVLAGTPTFLYLFVIVYGPGYGARSPLRAAVMGDFFGRAAFGSIFGIQGAATAVAAALGPAIAGAFYDSLRNYELAFLLTAGALVLAGLALLAARRPPRRAI